ncbi:hypothetical protein KAX02_00665 [candidate division WOR-3 bacterium]|nr:hypothetical protein [candidate division WOR-3 bacterium]
MRSALGAPAGAVAAGTAIVELEDCEDAWDQAEGVNSGVIASIDSGDYKKGSASVKLVVTAGVAAGEILATELVTSTDMKADTDLKVWIKCSKDCDAGHLAFMISEVAGCGGVEHSTFKHIPVPALVAGVWKECTIKLGYISRSDIAFVDGGAGVDTITTVDGDFVVAGFVSGDIIHVTGTDTSNGDYTLTGVAAKTLTMATATLPGNEAAGAAVISAMDTFNAIISIGIKMVTDKAECTIHIDDVRRIVTSDASNTKDHVFTPVQADFHALCTLPPYTLEVYRDQSNDKAWQYKGAVVNTLSLSFGTGEKILKATAGILAKEEAEIDKESVSLETTNPFTWNQAQVKIATNDHDYLEDFTLDLDNKIVPKFSLNESSYARMFYRDGYRTFNFSFTTDFVDKTEYDKFMLGTQQAFQIVFTGASCEDGYYYKLQIDIPAMRYIAYPINVDGPGRLSVKVIGKAKYSSSDGYAVKITLTNLETSY